VTAVKNKKYMIKEGSSPRKVFHIREWIESRVEPGEWPSSCLLERGGAKFIRLRLRLRLPRRRSRLRTIVEKKQLLPEKNVHKNINIVYFPI